MADTLSCQWETLHSQQLRSIKKSIDSDHGIYRYSSPRPSDPAPIAADGRRVHIIGPSHVRLRLAGCQPP